MKKGILFLLVADPCFGQQQHPSIQDLNLLVDKQVIVQRAALCQPSTYNFVVTYAGKQAKVVSLKPSNNPHLSEASMSRLTPEVRAMMEDSQKAATILVQFEDGTKLDTCFPIGPSRLSNYFELAPGEVLQSPGVQVKASAAGPASAPAPATPVSSSVVTPELLIQSSNTLSDDEVKRAIGGEGKNHWVLIQDMGLMAAQGNQVPSITLFMPDAVLAIRSESAKKQYTQYVPSEEEKRRALMIVAEGYAGKTITEGCTSITRIVLLSDSSGGIVEESYLSEPMDETWRNNLGATNRCQALRVKFSFEAVKKVRAAAHNGEFLVAVFSGEC